MSFTEAGQFITDHYIELVATITGLIYVFFSARGSILLWPFGLVSSALYVYICYSSGIYADMGINMYYFGISIYGWMYWKKKSIEGPALCFYNISRKQTLFLIPATLLIFLIIVYILKVYTDSNIVLLDSFTTSLSITATWMLSKKLLQNWILWIIVDSISVGLYIYKELYFTSFLFFVYTLMAIYGFNVWKKHVAA